MTELELAEATRQGIPSREPRALPESPRWALRLIELSKRIRLTPNASLSEQSCQEAWLLLNSSIACRLRAYAARTGRISEEDSQDIAAEKSLDLLRMMLLGTWDISGRSPAEIIAFVSTVAHNRFLDRLRQGHRWVRMEDTGRAERLETSMTRTRMTGAADSPDALVQRKEFAAALRGCADRLDKRSRLIWLLRVFYSMSSKEIAEHPDINLKPAYVDVLLQRSREAIRKCMHLRGLESQDLPPGAFVELWQAFLSREARCRTE